MVAFVLQLMVGLINMNFIILSLSSHRMNRYHWHFLCVERLRWCPIWAPVLKLLL